MLGSLDRLARSFSISQLMVASLTARLLALYLLPSTPSIFAPDEGTYAFLASWVADSNDVEGFPGFGPGLYNTSKTLILPAAALVKFGLGELTAVRIISIGFGTLSIYSFTKIIFLTLGVRRLQDLRAPKSQRLVLIAIYTFAFMPSSFLWSTLALRESASIAMTLTSVFLLLRLRDSEVLGGAHRRLSKMVPVWILGILAISLSFGTRRQTAFVFVVFFCISLVIVSKKHNFFILTIVVFSGAIFGLLYSTTPIIKATSEYRWVTVEESAPVTSESKSPAPVTSESKSPAPVISGPKQSETCYEEDLRTGSEEIVCAPKLVINKEVSIAEFIRQTPILNLDGLEIKRSANRIGAQTQLSETKCLVFTKFSRRNLTCNLAELPYRLSSILFRPLPFIDTGSISNNLAAVENVIWIFLFLLFAYCLIVALHKRVKLYITIPTTIFVLSFATLSALYEGNLGTAFRHKSTILWGLILVVTVVLASHETNSKEKSQKS